MTREGREVKRKSWRSGLGPHPRRCPSLSCAKPGENFQWKCLTVGFEFLKNHTGNLPCGERNRGQECSEGRGPTTRLYLFIYTFYSMLEDGRSTVLWQFQADCRGTRPYIYTYPLSSQMLSVLALAVKNLPVNAGDARDSGSIPESGTSPGGGNGNPLQYSCPENSIDRGARWAI